MSKKNQVGQMLLTHNKKSLGGKGSAVQRDCSKKKKQEKATKIIFGYWYKHLCMTEENSFT